MGINFISGHPLMNSSLYYKWLFASRYNLITALERIINSNVMKTPSL